MKLKLIVTVAAGMAATTLLSTPIWAQPPGGMGGPGRMGGGGRGGMRGMRNSSKGHLESFLMGVGRLEHGKMPLNKAQAHKMVALISPWKKKPHMSDAEAQALSLKLSNVLTSAQKTALQQSRRGPRDGGGRRGGGGRPNGRRGGMGGGGFGGGTSDGGPTPEQRQQMQQRMAAMQSFLKIYNPFYPPTNYAQVKAAPERMRAGLTRRYQMTMALLAQLSKKAGK